MTGDFRNWGKWEGGRQIRGKVDRIEGGENCTGGADDSAPGFGRGSERGGEAGCSARQGLGIRE